MALTQIQVSELYVAIFNRASEGEGNTYWQTAQADVVATATDMLNTQVAKDYFGTSLDSDQAFIEHIYLNTLSKTATDDPNGIAYWVSELTSGKSRGEVVVDLITAAKDPVNAGDAQEQFQNRVEVSNFTAETLQTVEATKEGIESTSFGSALNVTHENATVDAAHQIIKGLVGAGNPINLTTDVDNITKDGHTVTDVDGVTTDVEATDTESTKTSAGSDTILAEVGTLQVTDRIVDSSATDSDTLEANMEASIGSGGNLGNGETGVTITDIENITLRGENAVQAYSLLNVTTTAEEANVVVNIDHNADVDAGKFTSTTDVAVNDNTVVSNIDGREIKEVNLIDRTRDMNFAEVSYDAVINLENGEINSIGIDAIDDSALANETITINMLNDKDGELVLGLFDDDDNLATDDDAAGRDTVHDGGGFKEVTLVSSDVAMNVTLATGTHLNNDNDNDQSRAVTGTEFAITDSNGFSVRENVSAAGVDGVFGTADDVSLSDGGDTPTPTVTTSAGADIQDNLTDLLNLEGSKDITITGVAGQLDQAVIKTEMTDGAKTYLDISDIKHTNVVNLTNAEVDQVNIDASTLGVADQTAATVGTDTSGETFLFTNGGGGATATVGISGATGTDNATQAVQSSAQIAIDDDTVAKITAIGDWGVLGVTGDADKTDDIELIINTGTDRSNNGTLFLGGDDHSQSESTSKDATSGDSTEAGNASSASTQGGDANNALMHVEANSTLQSLNIRSLLGRLTLDGDGDLRVENGGLIFDDSDVVFDGSTTTFATDTYQSLDAEGEGLIIDGFGGDWVDATAMTGDFRVILRDEETINSATRTDSTDLINRMNNDKHGIRMDFGSGDDQVVGLGSGAGFDQDLTKDADGDGTNTNDTAPIFGTIAGDNIDMGAGDDIVIIGINDLTDIGEGSADAAAALATITPETEFSDPETLAKNTFNIAIDSDTNNTDDDTVVSGLYDPNGDGNASDSTLDYLAELNYGNRTLMVHDRINAEVYLGEGSDTVIFRNQNSGFLDNDNGVRIKDFEAGNGGDKLGFDMFRDGTFDKFLEHTSTDGTKTILPVDDSVIKLDLFNNGEVIADTDTGLNGKYIINGHDAGNDNLNKDYDFTYVPNTLTDGKNTNANAGDSDDYHLATDDGADTGENDGNVVLISTADIHAFNSESAGNLWEDNASLEDGGTKNPGTDDIDDAIDNVADQAVFKNVVNNLIHNTVDGTAAYDLYSGHQYETIVLVGETTGTEGVKIFYVTDDPSGTVDGDWNLAGDGGADKGVDGSDIDGTPTASLIGFIEGININDLDADNFDFM